MPDFRDICLQINQSKKPYVVSVRDLMKSIGKYQRDTAANRELRKQLTQKKLTTRPEFEIANLESKITVLPIELDTKTSKPTKGKDTKAPTRSENEDHSLKNENEILAAVRVIGHLPSALREPIRIGRQEDLKTALTKMIHEGVDHLVVAQSQRDIVGVVTWASIGRANAGKKTLTKVSECMEKDPYIIPHNTPLFDAAREIKRKGLALILSDEKVVTGSVTPADIAEKFVNLSEPFLFIEQIENQLRKLLSSKDMGAELIKQLVNPSDKDRKIAAQSVEDLTFGEIVRAFENREIWDKLDLNLDRKLVVNNLKVINSVRNRIMHFHPDGISDEDLEALSKMKQLLQIL